MHAKIKKRIRFSVRSQCTWLGEIKVQHVLPNKFARAIGPFVFLEHILSYQESLSGLHKEPVVKDSNPHRGIVTLTYILTGEVEHLDSLGNHVKLGSGGVHCTKAGKGIVHDEAVRRELPDTYPDVSVIRFWVNLHSKRKSEKPDYFSLQSGEIPKQELDDIAGWIKILSGEYGNTTGKIPCYSKEFLYHIHLETGGKFSITTDNAIEYAAFLLSDKTIVNDIEFQAGRLVAFTSHGEIIEINNSPASGGAIDIVLFGGEPYNEPIVAEGAFVMNTPHEITQAYNDYYDGKYGRIKNK